MGITIWRFFVAIGLVYLLFVATAAAALLLVNLGEVSTTIMSVVSGLTAVGSVCVLCLAYPLARQRAVLREEQMLARQAHELLSMSTRHDDHKASREEAPRKKHEEKATRLARDAGGLIRRNHLPTLTELSHNGVLERAGVLRWTVATDDHGIPRPTLPLRSAFFAARGSFLYLFAGDEEALPSRRAQGAVPLFNAKFKAHRRFEYEGLPPMENLIQAHLSIAWRGKKNYFLEAASESQMREWCADLQVRAQEVSAQSAIRRGIYDGSSETVTHLAPPPPVTHCSTHLRSTTHHPAAPHERIFPHVGRGT